MSFGQPEFGPYAGKVGKVRAQHDSPLVAGQFGKSYPHTTFHVGVMEEWVGRFPGRNAVIHSGRENQGIVPAQKCR